MGRSYHVSTYRRSHWRCLAGDSSQRSRVYPERPGIRWILAAASAGPLWRPVQGAINNAHVAIRNASNQPIVFLLKNDKSQGWDKHTLYPHQSKTYYATTPGQGHFDIQVATADRGDVQYRLNACTPYSIVWNTGKGIWDVRTER